MSIPGCCRYSLFNHVQKTHIFNTPSSVDVGDDLLSNWAHDCRRILIECAVFALDQFFLPSGFLSLAPYGLNISTVAHRLCTILTHDSCHMLLPSMLFCTGILADSSLEKFHVSMWSSVALLMSSIMHHSSDLCVCVPQIESAILLFFG